MGRPVWAGDGWVAASTPTAGAMVTMPATSAAIIGLIEPVLAAAVAWVTLGAGEALNTAQLAGGLLVLAGVTLAETARTGVSSGVPSPPDVAQPVIKS